MNERYNFPSKKLYKRLVQLGAKPLLELGLGDDQHPLGYFQYNSFILFIILFDSYDHGLDSWLVKLWASIALEFNVKQNLEYCLVPESTFKLVFTTDKSVVNLKPKSNALFSGKVVKNERMTSQSHFQDVRDLEIECNAIHFQYDAGDVMVIKPKNIESQVQEVIDYFEWNTIADAHFVIEPRFPGKGTLKHCIHILQIHRRQHITEIHFDPYSQIPLIFFAFQNDTPLNYSLTLHPT